MFSWLSFSRKYLSRFQQKLIISCRSSLDWVTTLRGDGEWRCSFFYLNSKQSFNSLQVFFQAMSPRDLKKRFCILVDPTGAYIIYIYIYIYGIPCAGARQRFLKLKLLSSAQGSLGSFVKAFMFVRGPSRYTKKYEKNRKQIIHRLLSVEHP